MLSTLLRFLVAVLSSCLIVGCGGGGGGADSGIATTTGPTADAGAPQTVLTGGTVTLDGGASSNTGSGPLGYRWTFASKPGGSAATLSGADTAQPRFGPDVPGTYVLSLTVSDGPLASSPATVTITALPSDAITIAVDKAEPLAGPVALNLSGAPADASIVWYVDLVNIGSGTSATWNTADASNTTHLVIARVALATGQSVDIRRTLNVSNSSVKLHAVGVTYLRWVTVSLVAESPFGITSVSGTLDGSPLSVRPDGSGGCLQGSPCVSRSFDFDFDPLVAGSGNHELVVTAFDSQGASQEVTVNVPVSNAPLLTIVSPANGAIVHGALHLSGSVRTDKPGPVTVTLTAALGAVQFLRTSDATFDTTFDLTGLPAGRYALEITATDSTSDRSNASTQSRLLFVTSSSALARDPIGSGSRLLAADGGDLLLYVEASRDAAVHMRNAASGVDVVLQGAFENNHPRPEPPWAISGGKAYSIRAGGPNCTLSGACVFEWDSNGVPTNLSEDGTCSGFHAIGELVARDGFAAWTSWCDGVARIVLHDASSGVTTSFVPAKQGLGSGIDVARVGNGVELSYTAKSSLANSEPFVVYGWASSTGQSTPVGTAPIESQTTMTDGTRVAWSSASSGTTASRFLQVAPVSGGPVTPLSTTMASFALRDGVLAWSEVDASGLGTIKASTASGIVTLANDNTVRLWGTGGGFVVYSDLGKIFGWNATSGRTKLLMDSADYFNAVVGATRLYLFTPEFETFYELPLD